MLYMVNVRGYECIVLVSKEDGREYFYGCEIVGFLFNFGGIDWNLKCFVWILGGIWGIYFWIIVLMFLDMLLFIKFSLSFVSGFE